MCECENEKKSEGKLASIIKTYPRVWEDTKLMKALLMDFYPDDKITRNLIFSSVEERIPHDIYVLDVCTQNDYYRFVKRLTTAYGCIETKAEEIVSLWLETLEISIETFEPHMLSNSEIKELTIDELDLSPRAYNTLKRAGINTVEELLRKNSQEEVFFLDYDRFRRRARERAIEEAINKLKSLGWTSIDDA